MKRQVLISIAFFLCAGFSLAGEVDFTMRFFDKKVYYADERTGPVLVQVTVANNSAFPYRFKLADERVFSVDFEIKTMTNRPLEAAQTLIRKRTESRSVFFRELAIAPGESLSFTEDLRDYADLNTSGSYVVQAKLYPELYQSTSPEAVRQTKYFSSGSPAASPSSRAEPFYSNRLTLTLRPAPIMDSAATGKDAPLDLETGAVLVRENLPPDAVITYLLTARQKEQWEKYFLYLDLEAMIVRDGVRKREWLAASEEGRSLLLAKYRSDLQNALVDGEVSTIPSEFAIERTNYGPDTGTVVVVEKFRIGSYTDKKALVERKRYTYYLKKRDDIWLVYDYAVINLGTE